MQVSRAQVRQLAPSVHATGLVQSRAAADLAAAVSGRLQWVAEPGTRVSAGDVVARMDVRELSLARAEQAARVKRASVNLTSVDRELERLRASGSGGVALYGRPGPGEPRPRGRRPRGGARVARARPTISSRGRASLRRSTAWWPTGCGAPARSWRRGDVIARLVNPDELEIRLFVPLRHVRAIQPGDAVDVTADRRGLRRR